MSTNPTHEQTAYQRKHRAKKKQLGQCQENGCRNEAVGYRCEVCAKIHAARELKRKSPLASAFMTRANLDIGA